MQHGSCLCGEVAFSIDGSMRPVLACHCGQCRKSSGHFWAATSVAEADLTLERDTGLAWYRASDSARRGFCRFCGSSLFWCPDHAARIAVAAGSLDAPTGLRLEGHVFVADKADYHEIGGDLPCFAQFRGGAHA